MMELTSQRFLFFHQRICTSVGYLLPTDKSKWKFWVPYSVAVNLLITIFYPISLILYVVFYSDNLDNFMDSFFMCATMVACNLKGINVLVQQRRLRFLHDKILSIVSNFNVESNYEFRLGEEKAYRAFKYIFCLYFSTGISFGLRPLFVKENTQLYSAWMPFDWENNNLHFWIVYLYQFISNIYAAFTNVQGDSLCGCNLILVEGMLRALKVEIVMLSNIESTSSTETPRDSKSLTFELSNTKLKKLKALMLLYDDIVEYAMNVEYINSVVMLIQFTLSSAIICTTVYILAFRGIENSIIGLVAFVGFLVCLIFQPFFSCYYGQSVMDLSASLQSNLFHTTWALQNKEYRKKVLLFGERLQRPIELFFGKLFRLNLTSFVSIMKTAYSLFAFFNSQSE